MPFPFLVSLEYSGPAEAGIDVLGLIKDRPADVLDLMLCRFQDLPSWGAGGASSRALAILAAAVVESAGLASQQKIAAGWSHAIHAYYGDLQRAGVDLSEAAAIGSTIPDRPFVSAGIRYLTKGGRLDNLAGLHSMLAGLASVGWFVVSEAAPAPLGRYSDLQVAKRKAKAFGYAEAPAEIGPASTGRYAAGYRPWATVCDGWGATVYAPRFRHTMENRWLRAGGYPAPTPVDPAALVADLALSPADLWFLGWPSEAHEAERRIQADLGRPAKLSAEAVDLLSE